MAIKRVLYQSEFRAPFVPAAVVTLITAFTSTPFDTPRAPQYSAAEQQFSAYTGFTPPSQALTPNTPFDTPQAPRYPAAEQQFSAWHSPFFGTRTPITPEWTAFDTPQAPKYGAAEQQFVANSLFQPPPVTLIAAFTSTPFDAPQAPQYKATEQQFTAWFFSASQPTNTILDLPALPFDVAIAPQYKAAQQQFSAWTPFNPPLGIETPNTPFDAPRVPQYAAGEQQFTAWHSPFFGTQTPSYAAGFVPFDTPQTPKFSAAEQQFSVNVGFVFVPAGQTPNYLSTFTPFDEPIRLTIPPSLLQFIDFGMGPEVTTAPVEEVVLGRWGPDETKEERKRRHDAGTYFQWEEVPLRSEFAPEPVEHPPHEPQRTADEPAFVNKAKFEQASPEYLAAVLADVPDDMWKDPEILGLVEKLLENGWRR